MVSRGEESGLASPPSQLPGESMFSRAYSEALSYIDSLSPEEWMLVLVGVVLWGIFCMRSFSSQAN